MKQELKDSVGKRIHLIEMDDLDPVPPGTTGTIVKVIEFSGEVIIDVDWDISRALSVIDPLDKYEIIEIEVSDNGNQDQANDYEGNSRLNVTSWFY